MDFVASDSQVQEAEEEEGGEGGEPGLVRGGSHTLAGICGVDRVRAREALVLASGDMDRAALILMNMTGSGVARGGEGTGGVMTALSPAQELAELGGVTLAQAQELLTAAGGNLERAKANYILATFGISEKVSCLLHPQEISACPVCYEVPTTCLQLVQLQQCSHQYCIDCLLGWVKAEADSSSTGRIKCPHQQCACFLNHAELKELLTEENEGEEGVALFRQLDRRALELLTASDTSLHLCPSPDCTYIVAWDPEVEQGLEPCCVCPLCHVENCLACGTSPYHHNMTCAQHLQSTRQNRVLNSEGRQLDLDEQEAATLAYLQQSGFRVCRQCKGGVVKSGGCDKMKCRCGYRFCYQCDAENARCNCTPRDHGFWDNIKGGGDFSNLR